MKRMQATQIFTDLIRSNLRYEISASSAFKKK